LFIISAQKDNEDRFVFYDTINQHWYWTAYFDNVKIFKTMDDVENCLNTPDFNKPCSSYRLPKMLDNRFIDRDTIQIQTISLSPTKRISCKKIIDTMKHMNDFQLIKYLCERYRTSENN